MNPSNTVFDAKRLIGRKFQDSAVQSDIKLWPFTVKPGDGDKPMIEVEYKGEQKTFSSEEVSSMILVKMKEVAEAYLSKEVKNAGYRARLLQRLPASGYQGRCCHRWPQLHAYH